MEAQQTIHRTHVERWMYYPISLLEGYHFCVSREPRTGKSSIQRLLQQGYPQSSTRMERYRVQGSNMGYSNSSLQYRLELLRRSSIGKSTSKLTSSPKRLLWRAYLPYQATICQRKVQGRHQHSYQLDR